MEHWLVTCSWYERVWFWLILHCGKINRWINRGESLFSLDNFERLFNLKSQKCSMIRNLVQKKSDDRIKMNFMSLSWRWQKKSRKVPLFSPLTENFSMSNQQKNGNISCLNKGMVYRKSKRKSFNHGLLLSASCHQLPCSWHYYHDTDYYLLLLAKRKTGQIFVG